MPHSCNEAMEGLANTTTISDIYPRKVRLWTRLIQHLGWDHLILRLTRQDGWNTARQSNKSVIYEFRYSKIWKIQSTQKPELIPEAVDQTDSRGRELLQKQPRRVSPVQFSPEALLDATNDFNLSDIFLRQIHPAITQKHCDTLILSI